MFVALAVAASISVDFEAASLGRVERVTDTHFRCAVAGERDQDQRNRQATWYPMARFSRLLTEQTMFAPSRPSQSSAAPTPEAQPGRMTVVQGLYERRRIPAFLMEQRIARSPKLGRIATVEDRLSFGGDLVRVLWETVRRTGAE